MNIINTIDLATNEYISCGRNADFVAWEDHIIDSQDMFDVYRFARYTKGADIDKLQSVVLQSDNMEACFYFAKYVKGADVKQFLQKAIDQKNKFWVHKFVSLAISPFNNRKDEISDFQPQLAEYGISFESKRKGSISGLKKNEVEDLIGNANKEYKRYLEIDGLIAGLREEYHMYITIGDEKNAGYIRNKASILKQEKSEILQKVSKLGKKVGLTTGTGAEIFLFARHVPIADVADLQRSLMLHGDPFNMSLFARYIKKTDYELIHEGLELSLRDYTAISEKEKNRLERIESLKRRINRAIATQKSDGEIRRLREELRQTENEEHYSNLVKHYKKEVECLLSSDYIVGK